MPHIFFMQFISSLNYIIFSFGHCLGGIACYVLITCHTICLMCIAGNPRVTPEVTRDVCLLARLMAANLHFSQIEDLMFEVPNMLVNINHI